MLWDCRCIVYHESFQNKLDSNLKVVYILCSINFLIVVLIMSYLRRVFLIILIRMSKLIVTMPIIAFHHKIHLTITLVVNYHTKYMINVPL